MIDFIRGNLIEKGQGWLVIENRGTGFRIDVPVSMHTQKWQENEEVKIFTRMIMKEDGLYLYGFAAAEERNLFNLITGVSGFGPRLALSVLGVISVSEFYIAVLEEDTKTLCKIPGIGRKSAQRLILELKEKLPAMFPEAGTEIPANTAALSSVNPGEEALHALYSLGYSRSEAASATEHILSQNKDSTTEELVKGALKIIASRSS